MTALTTDGRRVLYARVMELARAAYHHGFGPFAVLVEGHVQADGTMVHVAMLQRNGATLARSEIVDDGSDAALLSLEATLRTLCRNLAVGA